MATKTVGNKPALLVWAHKMLQHHTGNWRLAPKDVVKMLIMPSIMVGVHFEANLGQYSDVTIQWHAYPGEFSTQPGFRIMELHQNCTLYLLPHSGRKPGYVESQVNELDQQKKCEQIEKGIRKRHAELIKMVKYLMSPPLNFNFLFSNSLGPHFVRALVAVVKENDIDFPNNNGEYWNLRIVSVKIEQLHQEQTLYNLLHDRAVGITHWYKQIGFNQAVIHRDLKKLTMEEQGS
jgi:hypothetical protein